MAERLTAKTVHTVDGNTLRAALRAGAARDDMNRRAALEALLGYNGGELADRTAVRHFVHVDRHDGYPYIDWHDVAESLAGNESDLFRLNSTALYAVQFAAAMATGAPMPELPRALNAWGSVNSVAMLRAFAIALGIDTGKLDQVVRLHERETQMERIRSLCEPNTNTTPWGGAVHVRMVDDEPVDEAGEFANGPVLAVAVVDVLRVLDAPLTGTAPPAPAAVIEVDPDALSRAVVDGLHAAGETGTTLGELVIWLAETRGIKANKLAVVAALGMAASDPDSPVRQPTAHGRYYHATFVHIDPVGS
jgi:hypothetical protein